MLPSPTSRMFERQRTKHARHRQEGSLFDRMETAEGAKLFAYITISRDGGFSRIDRLWAPMRVLLAAIKIFMTTLNCRRILAVDSFNIASSKAPDDGLYITELMVCRRQRGCVEGAAGRCSSGCGPKTLSYGCLHVHQSDPSGNAVSSKLT
mmetsp:Transcript_128734/g.412395  ORF Transcript_128734/g.412395 Transcript_128734/m.412395 type:complete len:151 (+) Transcript_128734:33-485(+)